MDEGKEEGKKAALQRFVTVMDKRLVRRTTMRQCLLLNEKLLWQERLVRR
jgi:hypothetical protein